MNSAVSFRLQLFGRPSIKAEGGALLKGAAAQRRRVALLALLSLAEDRGLSRDKILGYLWPENDTEHGRNLLNVAVYALRKSLGEEAIISDGEGVRINNCLIGSDIADFQSAINKGDEEGAVGLYSGPFLDGYFINDAPEFERWVERERDRLGRLYCGALESLADRSEHDRDFDRAAAWWKSRAAYDPYDTRVTLKLMRALDASGNTAGALQQAQTHERLLREDFGVQPPADLMSAMETLRSRREISDRNVQAPAQAFANGAGQNHSIERIEAVEYPAAVEVEAGLQDAKDESGGTEPGYTRSHAKFAAVAGLLGIAAVTGGGWFVSRPDNHAKTTASVAPAAATARTIAVLPFTNMSADAREEYFSDGLTDELIGTLSQVKALRVTSRTSAFVFKGQNRDVRSIGRLLNVGTVLEGSVRKAGDRVRVTAQLISTADGFHLWSETFERDGTDIFAIQADLALRIATALEAKLTTAERQRIARTPTSDSLAHTLYLQARYFYGQRRSGSLAKAIDYYQRAIGEDPQYADAYAGLAAVYPPLGVHGYISPSEGRKRMREPAMKAAALDPGSAQAHTALGGYRYAYEWNWPATEYEFRKAIALNPAAAHGWYSVYLTAMHRNEEAVREARKDAEGGPLSAVSYSQLGFTLVIAGRPDLAINPLKTAIELDSGMAGPHLNLGMAYELLGKPEQALHEYEKAATPVGQDAMESAYLGRALVRAGRRREGREILDALIRDAAKTHNYTPHVALLYDALGEHDAAVSWLQASARERHPAFPHSVVEPAFASLKRDHRIVETLHRNGLR